ncbi:hypothetical protein GCM10010174_80810 [Kutzneria viridogrisea]|uniref:5'-deoxynucleotidase YfbR-like HD superfamily hydrolase n=1 Tax=Kutzneria viridogrisea TaxID=47990 RepID=A0ABR6BYZ7_9PSEU|nr:5'-deoxynucleotidase YfbR-like HD superfamily hydrolase [Kutzneria viridogrisea]
MTTRTGFPVPDNRMGQSPCSPVGAVVDALLDLGRLALVLGGVERTACYHPDQAARETVTDHTVMLGWTAPALAARCYPHLDTGLVAQYALIHDAVEVYAGDTQTLLISPEERQAKADREARATARIHTEFRDRLPWFPEMISRYERQTDPEARFVRVLDKVLPKITHLLDELYGLLEFGISRTEFADSMVAQARQLQEQVGEEFALLLEVHANLVARVLRHPAWGFFPAPGTAEPTTRDGGRSGDR